MRLKISTPTKIIEDVDQLHSVRAEDETGAFGIMPGHTDFVTTLPISVVSWQGLDGSRGFVLVRKGVMSVRDGAFVEIATRGGFRSDELHDLGETVWDELRRSDDIEDVSRTSDTRMHLATIRQIEKVMRAARGTPTVPPKLSGENSPATKDVDQ